MESDYIPVIAGLVVGISFVIAFALFVRPQTPDQSFDYTQIISNANGLPEVKAYSAQYPNAEISYDNTGESPVIRYEYERLYENGTINTAILSIGVIPITNMPDQNRIYFDCSISAVHGFGSMGYDIGLPLTEALKTTSCAK